MRTGQGGEDFLLKDDVGAPPPKASPLGRALAAIGDPWSFLVHQEAFFGVRRFDDFRRNLGVARSTLVARLAHLVDHALLERRAYQQNPPRYEYRLTQTGLDSYPYAVSLTNWGDTWLAEPGNPPVRLRHKLCGKLVEPLALCEACEREVRPEDVAVHLSAATGLDDPQGGQTRISSRPELYAAGRRTSVAAALSVIGDRWGFYILWLAFAQVTKFDHFHRLLGIARTVLAERLDRLVRQGVLDRRPYSDRPSRHEYLLTAKGRDLCVPLLTLHDWGERRFGPSDRAGDVMHKACGEPLHIRLVCAQCRRLLKPYEVSIEPGAAGVTPV